MIVSDFFWPRLAVGGAAHTYTEGQPTLFNCYYQYTMTDNKFTTDDMTPTRANTATDQLIGSIVAAFKK